MNKQILTLLVTLIVLQCYGQNFSEFMRPKPSAIGSRVPIPANLLNKRKEKAAEKKANFSSNNKNLKLDSNLQGFYDNYVTWSSSAFNLKAMNEADFYMVQPSVKIINSSLLNLSKKQMAKLAQKKVEKTPKPFGKYDDIAAGYLTKNNQILILKSNGTPSIMSEFTFESNSDLIKMDGNEVILSSVYDFYKKSSPTVVKIKATHIPTGKYFTFKLYVSVPSSLNVFSEDNIYALQYNDSLKSDYALLYDLTAKSINVVKLPLTVNANGRNGKNGRNGTPGLTGSNSYTITTKTGSITMPGTCGTSGGDGGDGEDGDDGGHILFLLDKTLYKKYDLEATTINTQKGLGGKGGRGGAPGRHGMGAICFTYLKRGNPGEDGVDGIDGSYKCLLTDLKGLPDIETIAKNDNAESQRKDDGNYVVDCQGNKYPIVKIGEQYWMAANLMCTRYDTESDMPHVVLKPTEKKDPKFNQLYTDGRFETDTNWDDNDSIKYNKFMKYKLRDKAGYLYTWSAAMGISAAHVSKYKTVSVKRVQGICPNGWHLPSVDEWRTLTSNVNNEAVKLKSKAGWYYDDKTASINGDDTYGFKCLPAGYANGYGMYEIGQKTYFWTSDAEDKENATNIMMNYNKDYVGTATNKKHFLFSVRCVKN